MRKLIYLSIYFLEVFLFLTWFSYFSSEYIIKSTSSRIYTNLHAIPKKDFALVLGASKYLDLKGRHINLYFKYRMEAAAELYHAGKVKHILVSGDNHSKNYDEPTDMKNYLIDLGVPAHAITCDYAGFRTYDSMLRGKEIFGINNFIIVSQEFHNQRALFICDQIGVNAIAFNAKEPYRTQLSLMREYFAKSKAVIDCWLGIQPKFLGKKELIVIAE